MTTFVLLAAVLTIAGVALVAIPLLRAKPGDTMPAPWAALVAAGVLAVGSTVLYVRLTNWSWQTSVAEDTPQTMVARLARRLEQNPDNLEGWLMLGRSYTELQEYQLSVRAFQRADRLAGGKSSEALIGEAEALARSDENELDGRAAKLIEQALEVDPDSGKALFFGRRRPRAERQVNCRRRDGAGRQFNNGQRRRAGRQFNRSPRQPTRG